jgi:adenylosuccinate lyase
MRANLDLHGGVVLSENLLLALVQKGALRQDAYRWVQRAAHASLAGESTFRAALAAEPEIRKRLSERDIDRLLDPARHLEHLDLLFRRGLGTSGGARQRQARQRPAVRKPRGGAH